MPLIPIAMMHREAGNGTRPVDRDSNAVLCSLAPELLDLARMVLADPSAHPDQRMLAGALVGRIDARTYAPTPGPWRVISGAVYAGEE